VKGAKSFCPLCLKAAIGGTTHQRCKRKLSLDGLICVFDYSTPVKELIQELKYRFVKDLEKTVSVELKKVKLLDKFDFSSFSLVPIPLSKGRKNWRGFNQTEILGKLVVKRLKIPFEGGVLVRKKETKPQTKLPRKDRVRQTLGAFASINLEKIKGGNFIIFDDVWTTGATMKSAARVLKQKGAKRVWGLALATSH
jgi:ComF family protein